MKRILMDTASEKHFFEISVISQRDPSKDPQYFLDKITEMFIQFIPMEKSRILDTAGRRICRLECKNNHDTHLFVELWSSFLASVLKSIMKDRHAIPQKNPLKQPKEKGKPSLFIVIKITTSLDPSNYLINLANQINTLLGLDIYYETVLDGVVLCFQNEADFNTPLYNLGDEKKMQKYIESLDSGAGQLFEEYQKTLKKFRDLFSRA